MDLSSRENFYNYSGDYVIFGAGGLAHELWGWIKNSKDVGRPKNLIAFIDDNIKSHGAYDGVPVVGRSAMSSVKPPYLVAIGSSNARKRVVEELVAEGWNSPLTYIHESVVLGVNVSIGDGVVVCPRSSLSSDSTVQDFVLVNGNCGVAHDVVIGAYSTLLGSVSLNGNVTLGSEVTVGAGALIYPGRRIGERSVIGMGSVVFTHVKSDTTVLGNPARSISL